MPTDPWFQSLFAERIGGAAYGKSTDIYKFEKIKRAKRKALADSPDRRLLDFGIGENDDMAPAHIRAALTAEGAKRASRGERFKVPMYDARAPRTHEKTLQVGPQRLGDRERSR